VVGVLDVIPNFLACCSTFETTSSAILSIMVPTTNITILHKLVRPPLYPSL